ncbi:hypothetical protein L596_011208 [Steinernema carpocapsae]|uniref:Uncharacterized protein n=1 Tax=Steinernema carpocapsae TaxID=34508 RepID=A0A4U5NTN8_STECR|nr:hypothetical protein L596_011208 [Steinernema carpocapsae]
MISKRFHLLRALLLLFACSAPESVTKAANFRINDDSYEGDFSGESEPSHHFHARNLKKADFSDLASPSESNVYMLPLVSRFSFATLAAFKISFSTTAA